MLNCVKLRLFPLDMGLVVSGYNYRNRYIYQYCGWNTLKNEGKAQKDSRIEKEMKRSTLCIWHFILAA